MTQDLMEAYPKADIQEEDAVWDSLDLVYERYGCQRFIFVFDEWDCISIRTLSQMKTRKNISVS